MQGSIKSDSDCSLSVWTTHRLLVGELLLHPLHLLLHRLVRLAAARQQLGGAQPARNRQPVYMQLMYCQCTYDVPSVYSRALRRQRGCHMQERRGGRSSRGGGCVRGVPSSAASIQPDSLRPQVLAKAVAMRVEGKAVVQRRAPGPPLNNPFGVATRLNPHGCPKTLG